MTHALTCPEPLPVSAEPSVDDLELALTTLPQAARRLIVMLPAHNEEAGIDLAIDSLAGPDPSSRPDRRRARQLHRPHR